jgi:hypothetical protein
MSLDDFKPEFKILVKSKGPSVETTSFPFPNDPCVPVFCGGESETVQNTRPPLTEFEQELRKLINKYCIENNSNTPDLILAEYLAHCLDAFNIAVKAREKWYGRKVFNG